MYRIPSTLVGFILSLLLFRSSFAIKNSAAPSRKHAFMKRTMPPRDKSNDSAVLTDLKETIRTQAAEIQDLKKQIRQQQQQQQGAKQKAVSQVSHGGGAHGGGGGAAVDPSEYLNKSFASLALSRVGWLSLFLVSLSLTAVIMNGFEHTLSRQIELAYFVPLLAGHGGNTGGQTVGTVLSAMSSGAIQPSDAPRVIAKEAMSGFTVGCLLGAMVGPVVHYIMGISVHVSTVVSCTLPLTSTIAATLGSSIPFLCTFIGLDPALVSAPAMTSFVDVTGLLSYFVIANQIFAMFGIEL